MKNILRIALCAIMMAMCTTAVQAQDNKQSNKQRMTREQLAEKQGKYIAHELVFDEQTTQKFLATWLDYQKEVWALGPRLKKQDKDSQTEAEAEQAIKQELQKEQLKDANVTVELQNMTYTVTGEVNTPGVYKIEKDKLTLFEALGQAQDLGVYGKRDSIMVIRTENNKRTTYMVSLNSGKDLFNSEAYYIHQNDIIYVKPNDVKARQSTANGNETRSISFWMSIVSVLTTVAILVFK